MAKYKLIKQNSYPNIKYPSSSNPSGTVKSSGCGPTAMLMIIENMLGITSWTMASWIKWVIGTGARVNGGTNMSTLSRAVANKYNLKLTMTSDETTLISHLKKGGMAIANVGGKRSGWPGLFSTAGHFITVFAVDDTTGKLIVGDPAYTSTRFSSAFRKARVTVKNQLCYVSADNLHLDTLKRTPNYYLLSKIEEPKVEEKKEENTVAEIRYETFESIPEWGKEAIKYYQETTGTLKGVGDGKLDISHDMLRVLCIVCPKIYNSVEECPTWAQEEIQALVDSGKLKGDLQGNLGLTLEMMRTLMIAERDAIS